VLYRYDKGQRALSSPHTSRRFGVYRKHDAKATLKILSRCSKRCAIQIAYMTNGQVGYDYNIPAIFDPRYITSSFHSFVPTTMIGLYPFSLSAVPLLRRLSASLRNDYIVRISDF